MRSRWHDMWIYLAAILLAMALASNAYGQDAIQQEEDKITYKKKTSIDFSDKMIEGELTKPEGSFVGVRKDIKFKNFIKVRANFRDKLSESSDNI
jgi:hypothetical protein